MVEDRRSSVNDTVQSNQGFYESDSRPHAQTRMGRKDDSRGKQKKPEIRVANPLAKLLEGHTIKPQSMKTIGQDIALKTVPSIGHLSEGNDKNVSILSSKTKYSSG